MRNQPPVVAARELLPLLRELGDLKRIISAKRGGGSIASRLFAGAWADLVRGDDVRRVAFATTADALGRARLGNLDEPCLQSLGLADEEIAAIRDGAVRAVADVLPPALVDELIAALSPQPDDLMVLPPFVEMLTDQPRAGVTCPGKPRIFLQPPENHAEHCLMVAVYGVVLSPGYGADPGTVFLAALAHHLHNAAMPDSGFTGEMLLGQHLEPVMARATAGALGFLASDLRERVVAARTILPDAATPEGRAFHAADVLDRVLEIEQHFARTRLTMDDVLGGMALVHEGPVKPFHDSVLAEAGLL